MTAGDSDPARPLAAAILERFTPGLSRPTVVRDPDGLLRAMGILGALGGRGFRVLRLGDPMAFRFDYETRFRPRRENREKIDPLVIVEDDETVPPFDILVDAEQVALSLTDFFPKLNPRVVGELAPDDREALYCVQGDAGGKDLGADETRDLILRHLFGVAPETIRSPADLLAMLLERHYAQRLLPAGLDDRLLRVMRGHGRFQDWALDCLLRNRETFLAFLAERWPRFLDRRSGKQPTRPTLAITGPSDLPFEHPRVRAYVDTLFLEGLLTPVEHDLVPGPGEGWIQLGIRQESADAPQTRVAGLLDLARKQLERTSDHHDWRRFARIWSELKAAFATLADPAPATTERVRRLERDVDEAFGAWLPDHYGPLASLPPTCPVMLHHVPRQIARELEEPDARVALLVLDGLALSQWVLLRDALKQTLPGLEMRERTVFAWIPTLTVVSRQALFAGQPPLFFSRSITTTAREASHWTRFLRNLGVAPSGIAYRKKVEAADLEEIEGLLANPQLRALALVVNTVDDIMHGMQLGERGMASQVREWARERFLTRLLDRLLGREFTVWLTSDHGNLEARGMGRPGGGVLADLRGERVRIFPDETLRDQVADSFPDAEKWDPVGLPEGFFPLLAPCRQAFVPAGRTVVGHGGANIEEVIVPLVRIRRDPA